MIYAIGDIHGCSDLLINLYDQIKKDSLTRLEKNTVVFLGDYIDRGYDSKGVIQFLNSLKDNEHLNHIFLKGNHEDMFFDAYRYAENMGFEGGNDVQLWLGNGGKETARSYDVNEMDFFLDPDNVRKKMFTLRNFIINKCRLSYREKGFFFSHAGVDPRLPISQNSPSMLLWVRDIFLNSEGPYYMNENSHDPVFVVHGHSPLDINPIVKKHSLNLDTGSVWSNRLTAAVLDTKNNKIEKFIRAENDNKKDHLLRTQ